MRLIEQLGQLVGEFDRVTLDAAKLDSTKKVEIAVTALRDSVPEHANTLNKLYRLLQHNRTMFVCEDNLERLLLDNKNVGVGDQVFVKNDGDNKWAFYMIIGVVPRLLFVKTLDQDDILDSLNALKVKALYEANANTNVFTDIEKAYLKSLVSDLKLLNTNNRSSYKDAINDLVGAINTFNALLADQSSRIDLIESGPNNIGTLEDFLEGIGDYNDSIGTLSDFIDGFNSFINGGV